MSLDQQATKIKAGGRQKQWQNLLFHIFSTALATTSSLHTLFITITTFSLAPNSFHPSTLSIANLSILTLSSATYSYPIIRWSMSSTSPFPHSLHTLSSLLTPCHLPTSIPNSAVPPLNLVIILLCLLQSIHTYGTLHSLSINLPVISNFDFPIASSLQSAFAVHNTVSFNSCFTSFSVTTFSAITSNPLHPHTSKLWCKSFTHLTLLPSSKASSITTFTNLSLSILITCTQKSITL